MLRYVLLALLADGQARHGYALMKAFADRCGVRVSAGNVYRELQRLVGEGLIITVTNPSGADPRRAPYAITERGRQAVDVWLSEPIYTFMRQTADGLSARLALVGDIDSASAIAFLEELHTELWNQAKAIERERRTVAQREAGDRGTFPIRGLLLGRRARDIAADIELVDDIRTRLGEWHMGSVGGSQEAPASAARRAAPRSGRRQRGE